MKYAMLDGHFTEKSWFDLNITHADQTYIYDNQNRRFLDLRSGLWNVSLGYVDDIYDKVKNDFSNIMSNKIPFIDMHSFYTPIYNKVAANITTLLDNKFDKVFFTNTGSECTELSLKLAINLQHKAKYNRILAFSESYHGTFFGGISVSGLDRSLNTIFNPKYGEVTFIDFPKNANEEKNLLTWLKKNAENFDLMIVEPILGSAGILSTSISFMNNMLKILKGNNVITIFDEVATGFYKTGSKFYFNKLSVIPDIINLSKSINNGIAPFGCVCVSNKLIKQLEREHVSINHFSTQNGNLLGYVSTKVVTDFYLKNELKIQSQVDEIVNSIQNTFSKYKINYRQMGTMASVPLDHIDPLTFARELSDIGILVYFYKNSNDSGISIFPQYSSSQTELKKALTIIAKKASNYQS